MEIIRWDVEAITATLEFKGKVLARFHILRKKNTDSFIIYDTDLKREINCRILWEVDRWNGVGVHR